MQTSERHYTIFFDNYKYIYMYDFKTISKKKSLKYDYFYTEGNFLIIVNHIDGEEDKIIKVRKSSVRLSLESSAEMNVERNLEKLRNITLHKKLRKENENNKR